MNRADNILRVKRSAKWLAVLLLGFANVLLFLGTTNKPTEARIDVVAERVNFTLAETDEQSKIVDLLYNPIPLHSLKIEGFEPIELHVAELRTAKDGHLLAQDETIMITPIDENASVIFEQELSLMEISVPANSTVSIDAIRSKVQMSLEARNNSVEEVVTCLLSVNDTYQLRLNLVEVRNEQNESVRFAEGDDLIFVKASLVGYDAAINLDASRSMLLFDMRRKDGQRYFDRMEVESIHFMEKDVSGDSKSTVQRSKVVFPETDVKKEYGNEVEYIIDPIFEKSEVGLLILNNLLEVSVHAAFKEILPAHYSSNYNNLIPSWLSYYCSVYWIIMVFVLMVFVVLNLHFMLKIKNSIINY